MHVLLLPRPPLLRERDENFGLDWKKRSYNLSICLPFNIFSMDTTCSFKLDLDWVISKKQTILYLSVHVICSFHFSDSTIDYIAQYRLVDRSRLEMYGRAFTLEDEDEDGIISYEVLKIFYVHTARKKGESDIA